MNSRARRGKLDLYQLAPVLAKEAAFVEIQVTLVSEQRLRRYQRRRYGTMQKRVHKLWTRFDNNDLSESKLLRACSYLLAQASEWQVTDWLGLYREHLGYATKRSLF